MNQYLLAVGLGLCITLAVMPILIPILHKVKFGQSEREEGPASLKPKTVRRRWAALFLFWYPFWCC